MFRNVQSDALYTLDELYRSNSEAVNLRANNCKTLRIGHRVSDDVYLFLVRCKESYSDSGGHFVSIYFDGYDDERVVDRQPSAFVHPNKIGMRVRCSCPAYLYQGSEYWSTQLGYGLDVDENRYPIVRDPNMQNFVCKHISRVYKNTLNSIRMKQLVGRYGSREITESDIRDSVLKNRSAKASVREVMYSYADYLKRLGLDREGIRSALLGLSGDNLVDGLVL